MQKVGIDKFFASLFETLRKEAKANRELEYSEGAVGITALIQCPLKAYYRQKYPDVTAESLEIDEGFLFEKTVKEALVKKYGDRVIPEDVVEYEYNEVKVEGHVDVVVNGNSTVLGLELKHMKFTPAVGLEEKDVITGEEAYRVAIPEHYVLQAKIQKYLLQRKYDKPVEHYLLVKTLVRLKDNRLKKVYVLRETREEMTEEELNGLIERFKTDPTPRYPWECRYCVYAQCGICEGREYEKKEVSLPESISAEVAEAIREYVETKQKLLSLEEFLKKALTSSLQIKLNGRKRTIGWVEREKRQWNVEAVAETLKEDALSFLTVKPRKAQELEKALAERGVDPDTVRTLEVVREWRGL